MYPFGEDGNEETDAADDAEHDGRQRVEPRAGPGVEHARRGVAGLDPVEPVAGEPERVVSARIGPAVVPEHAD
jgi:hypothetical protein